MRKGRVAFMTQTIDGRRASGTALVAHKWIEEVLKVKDEFEITFVHFEKSNEPIYGRGVSEIIIPTLPWPFNRRFFRQNYYFLTTKDRFDIFMWFQPRLYPFFWLAPARHILVAVHGAGDVVKTNRFNLMREIFNLTVKAFHKKIAIAISGSEYAKKEVVMYYGFNAMHVRPINNGVDPMFVSGSLESITQVKKKYRLPEQFFLGVARLIQNKNVVRTLAAYAQWAKSHRGTDIHFVNVGGKGPERSIAESLIRESGVAGKIHFLEYVETRDLPALYSAAFAFVHPVLNEGFTLPAIEAMACGTPAIISKTASPEITGEDALLVDPLSQEEIANAMRKLDDEQFRKALAERGLRKARTFTWEASGQKLVALLRELVLR